MKILNVVLVLSLMHASSYGSVTAMKTELTGLKALINSGFSQFADAKTQYDNLQMTQPLYEQAITTTLRETLGGIRFASAYLDSLLNNVKSLQQSDTLPKGSQFASALIFVSYQPSTSNAVTWSYGYTSPAAGIAAINKGLANGGYFMNLTLSVGPVEQKCVVNYIIYGAHPIKGVVGDILYSGAYVLKSNAVGFADLKIIDISSFNVYNVQHVLSGQTKLKQLKSQPLVGEISFVEVTA